MREREMDLVYRVLDDQILDVDDRRCGRVDDLELDGDVGGPLYLDAILSGRGAWAARLPRGFPRRLGERIFGKRVLGGNVDRVPWSEVADVDTAVHLRGKARELGLGEGDRRLVMDFERESRQ